MIAALLGIFTPCAYAHAEDDKNKLYPDFAKAMKEYGYMWEPHKVYTDDGWILTMFHIKGRNGKLTNPDKRQYPVLIQHGALDNATNWVSRGPWPIMPLKLVDRGYDVWLGNNRGVKYSNEHVNDGAWEDRRERWMYTWADLGKYDIPAEMEKVLELTGSDKLTLMGYSMGNAQMWYGLATDQDYFAPRVNRFISAATCIIPNPEFEGLDEEDNQKILAI